MKALIINDLSLKRNVQNASILNQQLIDAVKLVTSVRVAREIIKCSRNLINSIVYNDVSLLKHLVRDFDRDSRFQIMSWLSNHGPFWDDSRTVVDLDSFNLEDVNVTEQGLGEVGRLLSVGINACSYSFDGGELGFSRTPISISHNLEELLVGSYSVENIWNVAGIAEKLKATAPPHSSWESLLLEAVENFKFLSFVEQPHLQLVSTPFSAGASNRIQLLLGVLNQIAENTNDDGSLNEKAKLFHETYFVGEKPYFTDESDANKVDFKKDLTFKDSGGDDIFAPWHGKINTPKIRIHYEWPRPAKQKNIKILFIGPKVTKK